MHYRGKRIYPYLSGGPNEHDRLSPILKDTDFVLRIEGRGYARFSSTIAFGYWYSRVPEVERSCYEIVRPGWQKCRLDLDDVETESVVFQIRDILLRVLERRQIFQPRCLLYQTSERSYHIVVPDYLFEDGYVCETLARWVARESPHASCIDLGTYKRVQAFRIEGSFKLEKGYPKHLLGQKRGVLSQGYLSGILGHRFGSKKVRLHLALPVPRKSSPEIDRVEITIPDGFKIRGRHNNLVILTRTHPSMCSLCRRVHESENAYIILTDSEPIFRCWRYQDSS